MRKANYYVIDFLEYPWLCLAKFYSLGNWVGEDAEAEA